MNVGTASDDLPAASVILVASEGVHSIVNVMRCLEAQSAAAQMEIVIACRKVDADALRRLPSTGFRGITVVEADLSTSARARAGAIQMAAAPVLLFAEDHAFPIGSHWAERMIEAHRSHYAGVGPVVRNANPSTATSWINLLIEYGPWLHRSKAEESDTLPGHNSSYKRELLISYGERLADMLEAEWVLQMDLRRKGHGFWIDPAIEVAHLNFSRTGTTVSLRFLGGWMFAASRAEGWSFGRRMLYALAFPAIAGVRFLRLCQQFITTPAAAPHALRSLPGSFFYLLVDAAGEGVGYLFGDLGMRPALSRLEYQRWRNVRQDERHLALPT